MSKYVVSVSSGLGSAYAWHLTEQAHPGQTMGLFADVNGEHPDNYRFLEEITAAIGAPLVTLDNNGQTIWDVFHRKRFLANSRIDVCSRVLKREPILAWLKANCDPADTVMVLGIDWTEEHRFIRAQARWALDGWTAEAPMCDLSLDSGDAQAWLDSLGIKRCVLYDLGFSHSNCGGGCVKAGIKQFTHMLNVLPEGYAEWERNEEEMRQFLGQNISILKDRRGGTTKPMTLKTLRERQKIDATEFADEEWGACGCFTDEGEDLADAA